MKYIYIYFLITSALYAESENMVIIPERAEYTLIASITIAIFVLFTRPGKLNS